RSIPWVSSRIRSSVADVMSALACSSPTAAPAPPARRPIFVRGYWENRYAHKDAILPVILRNGRRPRLEGCRPGPGRLLHLSPRGGRGRIPSEAQRSEGIGVRGRVRESELTESPPHPTCVASLTLRSQVDLSPRAGRGGASRIRVNET